MRVVHVIPTYNEKANIGRMIEAIHKVVGKDKKFRHLILVVDDNSPDGTGKIVKIYQKSHRSIHLLSGPKKGLGEAMIRGLKYALSHIHPDVVIINEADFAFDPKHIPYMLKMINKGFDVIIGSRHVGDGHAEGWTLNRKINHWVANKFFATWVSGVSEVYDHNGAFRAIRVKGVLDRIDLNQLDIVGFGFFNYFLFKLTQVTKKFHEFPVTYRFRTTGESKVSFNPKYFRTYLRDVGEYIQLSIRIRQEKLASKLGSKQIKLNI